MANRNKAVPENVPGEFYVDATCIDCGTCRHLAPRSFAEGADYSFVYSQPTDGQETRDATRALLCCPTGSIGTVHPNRSREVMDDFPLYIEGGVYYSGFNSPKSFGGNSYFIEHPDGNWLIDSPKYLPHLVDRFEQMGGLRYIFLTHQDDVAEAARYAEHFGSTRLIHRADASAMPEAEIVLEGELPIRINPDFLVIPTPGHTRGHSVLLFGDRFLFSGDHVWGLPTVRGLGASRGVCWFSWPEQTRSMAKLLDYSFEWVLPGHGEWIHLPAPAMHAALEALVGRMRATV